MAPYRNVHLKMKAFNRGMWVIDYIIQTIEWKNKIVISKQVCVMSLVLN